MKKRPVKRFKSYVPFYKKRPRFRKATRDWDDPKYIEWRQAIFSKDNYRCTVCNSGYMLEAHHAYSWSKFPQFRYTLQNGFLLCRKCHKKLHTIHGTNTTMADYIDFKVKYGISKK